MEIEVSVDRNRILAKGVDSLYLYLAKGLNFGKLEEVGQELRIGEKVKICGMEFQKDKAYSRSYPVSFRYRSFLFYVNNVSMYIKVSALGFEMYGFESIINELYDILDRMVGHSHENWGDLLEVSRIDVYTDFEYNHDFDMERFKTKLRKRAMFISGKDAEGKTYYWGDRSRFCIRLYVKSAEIKKSGKEYLRPMWEARGFDGNLVWRLEFEYRRKRLDDLFKNRTLSEIGGRLASLWADGISRLKYMEERASGRNLYRKQVDPMWRELEDALFQDYDVPKWRVRAADIEYRRKRAVTWLCSHAVALGEGFQRIPEDLKTRYCIKLEDYERALRSYRLFSWG